MKSVLPLQSIKAWDLFTIQNEPITSMDLMERAAQKCTNWFSEKWDISYDFLILCGNGNNGGDGLAIARQLLNLGYKVKVVTNKQEKQSADNIQNLKRLNTLLPTCIVDDLQLNLISKNTIIIDAIYGTGLSRNIEGIEKEWIQNTNLLNNVKVSIDIPSGLFADSNKVAETVFQTDYTLTFQCFKRTFLFPESGSFCGDIVLLDIGLSNLFHFEHKFQYHLIDKQMVQSFIPKRKAFSHKGTYGHALLIVGSRGKMGAAILSAKACLRTGVGLLSVVVPEESIFIFPISVPEAMTITDDDFIEKKIEINFDAYAIGCGLGTNNKAKTLLLKLFNQNQPLILDADALNRISQENHLIKSIPKGSLLTPHPKEFDRLFGTHSDSFLRFETQQKESKNLEIYILLKGRYTSISTPTGEIYINTTGNPGMATGGSGDALSGILTGLYAQNKNMLQTAIIGCYIHGVAGDLASQKKSEQSLIASDIVECLSETWKILEIK